MGARRSPSSSLGTDRRGGGSYTKEHKDNKDKLGELANKLIENGHKGVEGNKSGISRPW